MTKQNTASILLVDDDEKIGESLSEILMGYGYPVIYARDTIEAEEALLKHREDIGIILLDKMMPKEDGISFCQRLSLGLNSDLTFVMNIPVVIVTAYSDEVDHVLAYEMGAIDYITKPFNPRVLVSKLKALLRFSESLNQGLPELSSLKESRQYRFSDMRLDMLTQSLYDANGDVIPLSQSEYFVLRTFVLNPKKVLRRDEIFESIEHKEEHDRERYVDFAVHRLRKKFNKEETIIKSIYGGGYMFVVDVDRVN